MRVGKSQSYTGLSLLRLSPSGWSQNFQYQERDRLVSFKPTRVLRQEKFDSEDARNFRISRKLHVLVTSCLRAASLMSQSSIITKVSLSKFATLSTESPIFTDVSISNFQSLFNLLSSLMFQSSIFSSNPNFNSHLLELSAEKSWQSFVNQSACLLTAWLSKSPQTTQPFSNC